MNTKLGTCLTVDQPEINPADIDKLCSITGTITPNDIPYTITTSDPIKVSETIKVEPISEKLERQITRPPCDALELNKNLGKETADGVDTVNHPSHYTYGTIEVIDYIEDKGFNYNLGNAIKYVSRAGHKFNAIEDLQKAVWYINREISRLQKVKTDE